MNYTVDRYHVRDRAEACIGDAELAAVSGVSLPTIRRMEASGNTVRGNVDTLIKVVEAFERAGVQLIAEGALSDGGGRGVRLKG